MVTTGNGREKIVIQDVVDKIGEIHEASAEHDFDRVHSKEDELKDLVLKGVQSGDFQGLTARVAAKLALSTKDLFPGTRHTA